MISKQELEIFPKQAQFRPHEPVEIYVHVPTGLNEAESIVIEVLRYQQPIRTVKVSIAELSHNNGIVNMGRHSAGGYRIVASLLVGDSTRKARTAFDVRQHWRETPRYGFLSDYHPRNSYQEIQDFFRKFHLNAVQFYDWMERHDALVPTTHEFVDPMGRTLMTEGILTRMYAMKEIGTATIAYAAVYASLLDYAQAHPNEGMYDNQGVQYNLIDIFYLMDITEESSWRSHILGEFERVIQFGFDGLHLDQYGYPKSAKRNDGSAFWMNDAYVSFINACRERLGDTTGLIFNNVSSYPAQATAKANQDAVYVEVWPPMVRYRHLTELITRVRLSTQAEKQVILAAYLKSLRENPDANRDAIAKSTLLVTAIIYASGGYHLILGESGGMLTEAYYPDYVPMTNELVEPLRAMYDIITADADLLSGLDVTDVTWSFVDGFNDMVVIDGAPISVEPRAGAIWVRVTTTNQGLVIHLINLLWLQHDEWNAIHDETFLQSPPLNVRIEWNHSVSEVLVQKAEDAVWERVEPEWTPHVRGQGLHVTVQPFDVWAMIFVPYEANVESE